MGRSVSSGKSNGADFKFSQIISAHLQIPLHHCKHAFDTQSTGTLFRELLSAKSHVRGEEDEDGHILGFLYYCLGRLSTVTIWSYRGFLVEKQNEKPFIYCQSA